MATFNPEYLDTCIGFARDFKFLSKSFIPIVFFLYKLIRRNKINVLIIYNFNKSILCFRINAFRLLHTYNDTIFCIHHTMNWKIFFKYKKKIPICTPNLGFKDYYINTLTLKIRCLQFSLCWGWIIILKRILLNLHSPIFHNLLNVISDKVI